MKPTGKDLKETKALASKLCPCNYSGKCVLFDECDCIIQNSHYSLAEGKILCKYFEKNVLPANPHLEAVFGGSIGRYIKCSVCGTVFRPTGNRQKYCSKCKEIELRKRKASWWRANSAKD